MKCVKNSKDEVRRVKDAEAAKLVASGQWHYVPKSVWKASRKKAD